MKDPDKKVQIVQKFDSVLAQLEAIGTGSFNAESQEWTHLAPENYPNRRHLDSVEIRRGIEEVIRERLKADQKIEKVKIERDQNGFGFTLSFIKPEEQVSKAHYVVERVLSPFSPIVIERSYLDQVVAYTDHSSINKVAFHLLSLIFHPDTEAARVYAVAVDALVLFGPSKVGEMSGFVWQTGKNLLRKLPGYNEGNFRREIDLHYHFNDCLRLDRIFQEPQAQEEILKAKAVLNRALSSNFAERPCLSELKDALTTLRTYGEKYRAVRKLLIDILKEDNKEVDGAPSFPEALFDRIKPDDIASLMLLEAWICKSTEADQAVYRQFMGQWTKKRLSDKWLLLITQDIEKMRTLWEHWDLLKNGTLKQKKNQFFEVKEGLAGLKKEMSAAISKAADRGRLPTQIHQNYVADLAEQMHQVVMLVLDPPEKPVQRENSFKRAKQSIVRSKVYIHYARSLAKIFLGIAKFLGISQGSQSLNRYRICAQGDRVLEASSNIVGSPARKRRRVSNEFASRTPRL